MNGEELAGEPFGVHRRTGATRRALAVVKGKAVLNRRQDGNAGGGRGGLCVGRAFPPGPVSG